MSQVPVGEGIGAILEPDNNCMKLTQSAYTWMVNIIVYDKVSNDET